jgi:hypothetical protein
VPASDFHRNLHNAMTKCRPMWRAKSAPRSLHFRLHTGAFAARVRMTISCQFARESHSPIETSPNDPPPPRNPSIALGPLATRVHPTASSQTDVEGSDGFSNPGRHRRSSVSPGNCWGKHGGAPEVDSHSCTRQAPHRAPHVHLCGQGRVVRNLHMHAATRIPGHDSSIEGD